ncbi:hypothetical protein EVJ58_g3872 [Rhodofomes roseus]|uniref:P-loop containing nucleoside triphosphate hydrolase protein n=1 Tax=Rhodofomes roseus TaxID=34475 RepID=A0A4Y9YJW0_9APHY|nr:hypothetical protein EVJ58_g3872 [Rhodofomes roseus]
MAVALQDVSDTLLPRKYQEEIFARAQRSNVIAALDTGSGKTYISTLLIKWISARDAGLGKIIVFLVPKVALVEQQGDFIARQTPLRVTKCCGATAIDLADRVGWKRELEDTDVLVMTAQIFLNILTHSHWSLDKVSLMVFDECHHTRKNHAYNGIMREYFQFAVEQRPKIFGMTASPIWNPRDAVESLATLERNLDAKVIAVREHVDELMSHSPKPEEVLHEYPAPLESYPAYPEYTLWNRLHLETLPPHIDIPVEKIRARYDITYASLGPYGAELFLYTDMKQRIAQMLLQASGAERDFLSFAYPGFGLDDLSTKPGAMNVELPPEAEDLQDALIEFRSFFEETNDPEAGPLTVHLKWCSPKVRELIDILFEHYTGTFQGIVFVEQRHVAACLATMLPRVPQLSHLIKAGQLIGHGAANLAKSQVRGMALRTQQDIVRMFRDKQINLLIATSVAEEGLDFPEGHLTHAARYKAFSESEPQLRLVYQNRDVRDRSPEPGEIEEEEERDDPEDIAQRERYIVPHTGAVLTYNNAIGLLNHLCSLIPHDRFTPVYLPKYTGDFQSTLHLPSSLPLPQQHLSYYGPEKRSKKEAKRAVAFLAVRQLHQLNVFDDFLLPAQSGSTGDHEDADGRTIQDVSKVPFMLTDVPVRDPWTRGAVQYVHAVYLDGIPTAGLVTGTLLPQVELVCRGTYVSIGDGVRVDFDYENEWEQRRMMEDFMRMGLWWCITGRGIALPLTCYLVPITHDSQVDWATIEKAVANQYGNPDWATVGEEHYFHTLVINRMEHGKPMLLRKIRTDITPMSVPPPGSREAAYPTYRDYWIHKFTRRDVVPEIPEDGPCIEGQPYARHAACAYALDNSGEGQAAPMIVPLSILYPMGMCRWADIPEDVFRTFHVLPELCHRITDVYRARTARAELSLPPITDDLLIQALTVPSANAGFNNQRLETLGDAVLKLSAVVHLFNRFPHRHEGQLDALRRNCVSNRTLMSRALEHRLEQYLTSEGQSMRLWRYTLPLDADPSETAPQRYAPRTYPRRSLQDCMEATLGAAFVTGGIEMGLRAGTALGLSFGGPCPWNMRYSGRIPPSPVASLFIDLQEVLGYQFRSGKLLLEAMTHPSFGSLETSSYQRLEFMGDALIDVVVMKYMYDKFPKANSGQLSWARSRAVCAPALASVAVKRLGLHRLLLVNNVELSITIGKHVPILEELTDEEIIHNAWKQDPPKALSDVLESLLGAVLVDSGYNFERAASVAEVCMGGLLSVLSPNLPKDPVSELMIWVAQSGCRKVFFKKSMSRPETKRNDGISVVVHDQTIVGPVIALNLSLAKGLAAERTRALLSDQNSLQCLARICTCAEDAVEVKGRQIAIEELPEDKKELDDETEEGFAVLARIMDGEFSGRVPDTPELVKQEGETSDEDDWAELAEVEAVLTVDPAMVVDVDARSTATPPVPVVEVVNVKAKAKAESAASDMNIDIDIEMDPPEPLPTAHAMLTTRATV